ncbi:MAG TPA: class I SAM-dependent methyltransferase [Sporolactobacillaceae bacterium]|nr:class I SAM-dependent methyltransferase [Sporolactobacillaceae bacterium]
MGREFIELFDQWATTYDESVTGYDKEYEDVFSNYEEILETVASLSAGSVLEFGVGTGNLSEKIREKGLPLVGVEPSQAMRAIANEKYPDLPIYDGDFLAYPEFIGIDTIVSSYAFHHLTDQEKDKAISIYSQQLSKGGRLVFADTLFESESAKRDIISWANNLGYDNLVKDLETEYYPLKSTMEALFIKHGFKATFQQMNRFVWVMAAEKH